VRHHLSLNRLFERQPRPVTDPGFGSYWTVNLEAPPGTKRPRKRGRPRGRDDAEGVPARKRGRPRKTLAIAETTADHLVHPPIATLPMPRFSHQIASQNQISSVQTRSSDHEEDTEDNDSEPCNKGRALRRHEEEYESEEDMLTVLDLEPRSSTPALDRRGSSAQRTSKETYHHTSSRSSGPENIIDHLRIEVEGLRRQSADAISVSVRMSDQLAEAQADASRARAALRAAENMLEDEARKRREAEGLADEESRLRRQAEDALRSLRERCKVLRLSTDGT